MKILIDQNISHRIIPKLNANFIRIKFFLEEAEFYTIEIF